MSGVSLDQQKQYFESQWNRTVDQLRELVRIPGVSFDGFPRAEVERSAQYVESLMKESGLEKIEILKMPGVHPYVYGEWCHDPKAPTLLLYAHHDVQPPGREEIWESDPFSPTDRQGPGGLRMYGRGTSDDKAGIFVHTSAISSFLKTVGKLPVNVKVLIEGEEEIGSGNLEAFLKQYQNKVQADVLVLTDTMNYDCGIPGLTTSLRGMVTFELELRALSKTLHSGMWGGPVPDPTTALVKMLEPLTDDKGNIAIPGFEKLLPKLSEQDLKGYDDLPFDRSRFREQAGFLDGTKMLNEGIHPFVQLWKLPTIAINGIQASSRKNPSNVINDSAWAKVSIRVAPGMDEKAVRDCLYEALTRNVPFGMELRISEEALASPWQIDPSASKNKPAFDAAGRALEKSYGKKPVHIGCGGTIPFVEPFANVLGGAPALLLGVEDPFTNAHGENESLLLSDFKSACLGQIYLFDELSRVYKS